MSVKENRPDEFSALRKDIGVFIREHRIEQSLTGSQLGGLLNVSQQQISRYENGITGINIETLGKILNILESNWTEFYHEVLLKRSGGYILTQRNTFPFHFK